MSEQDEREKLELRVRIAGDMVDCPKHDDERSWKDGVCLRCSIDGETSPGRVYRFGVGLRTPCMGGRDGEGCEGTGRVGGIARDEHGRRLVPVRWEEGLYECEECLGRGWVPASEFGWLLLVELPEAGVDYRIMPSVVEVWEWGQPRTRAATGDDPEAALYRAVLAVLEVAP